MIKKLWSDDYWRNPMIILSNEWFSLFLIFHSFIQLIENYHINKKKQYFRMWKVISCYKSIIIDEKKTLKQHGFNNDDDDDDDDDREPELPLHIINSIKFDQQKKKMFDCKWPSLRYSTTTTTPLLIRLMATHQAHEHHHHDCIWISWLLC